MAWSESQSITIIVSVRHTWECHQCTVPTCECGCITLLRIPVMRISRYALCLQISAAISSRSDADAASFLACLVSLTTTPLTRKLVSSQAVIVSVGSYVCSVWADDDCISYSGSPRELTRTSEQLQAVLDTLVQPQDLLLEHGTAFVEVLLPALCTVCLQTGMKTGHFPGCKLGACKVIIALGCHDNSRTEFVLSTVVHVHLSRTSVRKVL